jgi:ADP-ribose pyrophosphatase
MAAESTSHGPRLGVSVALWKDGALLLVKRGREPYAGQWSLPGGRVEFGEPLREAAGRELLEETAIRAAIGDPLDTFEIILPASGRGVATAHFVLIVFAGRYLAGDALAGDDAAAVQWATAGRLREIDLTPETRSLVDRRWPA